jgi:5'-deoxynucleotidase YfbR-like HD superfamily hydrolase
VPDRDREPQPEDNSRLADQVGFLLEADKLKSVLRRNYLADASRRENTAEHSWTLALMALVLAEHAAEPVDVAAVVRMVVLHDLVEVDAGDTSVYDEAGQASQAEREARAADRLYGLLPDGQGAELRAVWDEFEHGTSAEARFARSLDRFAGFLLNQSSGGLAWREQGVTADRVAERCAAVAEGAPALGDELRRRLVEAVAAGEIAPHAGESPAPGEP